MIAAGLAALLPLAALLYDPAAVLGEVWFALHADSLQLLQPAVQRHIHPGIWDYGIQPLLLWPAWAVALIPPVVIVLIAGWQQFRTKRARPDPAGPDQPAG